MSGIGSRTGRKDLRTIRNDTTINQWEIMREASGYEWAIMRLYDFVKNEMCGKTKGQ